MTAADEDLVYILKIIGSLAFCDRRQSCTAFWVSGYSCSRPLTEFQDKETESCRLQNPTVVLLCSFRLNKEMRLKRFLSTSFWHDSVYSSWTLSPSRLMCSPPPWPRSAAPPGAPPCRRASGCCSSLLADCRPDSLAPVSLFAPMLCASSSLAD